MKEQKNAEPDAFVASCPSRELLARIAEKWSMLVIVALKSKEMRFGELKNQIEGVSQKMLTQTLRNLERDGFVKRVAYNEMPLRVEYSLTPLGQKLVPWIEQLKMWVEQHLFEIQAAQVQFLRNKNDGLKEY